MPCQRSGADRRFGDDRAGRGDLLVQRRVLQWIDGVDTSRPHRNRAGRHRAVVGGGIDAAGQAGRDNDAGGAQIAGQLARQASAGGRRVAGADNAHDRLAQEMRVALEDDHRRRIGDGGERERIVGLDQGDGAGPGGRRRFELAFDFGQRRDADWFLASPGARQLGQRRQGPGRLAVALDQRQEGDRAHVLRPAQPQPVETFAVTQRAPFVAHFHRPYRRARPSTIFASLPRTRRPMLAACRIATTTATRAANSVA